MDFDITKAADRELLWREPIHRQWEGEKMSDDKQTCFNCKNAIEYAPNIDSAICMDLCSRGSRFQPQRYDALSPQQIVAKGDVLNRMVGDTDEQDSPLPEGVGYCMGELKDDCQNDCLSFGDCKAMIEEDIANASITGAERCACDENLSLNPKTQGCTCETRKFEGIPGEMTACQICTHKKTAETIIEQDMKRAMLYTQAPIILDRMEPKDLDAEGTEDDGTMRTFASGATRDTGEGKLDFEGFESVQVFEQFCKYMSMNRLQSDGQLRESDNWQAGFPMQSYVKSGYRHFFDWWKKHRKAVADIDSISREDIIELVAALCGLRFNIGGFLHELLKEVDMVDFDGTEPTKEMRERREKLEETKGS